MEHQYKHTVIWDVAVKVVYNYRTFICWPYLFDCQTTVLMSVPLLLMCAIVWMLHILCNRASYRLSRLVLIFMITHCVHIIVSVLYYCEISITVAIEENSSGIFSPVVY